MLYEVITQLAVKYPEYNEQNFQLFEKALKEQGIKLSSDVARAVYKNKTLSEKDRSLTDTELDPQLKKAVEILSQDSKS